ncbi:MAG TPA: hypothetical protein VLB81_11665 [Gaiellales bacterium]|nr:hypothetical protein [Gaiellales bacterium]
MGEEERPDRSDNLILDELTDQLDRTFKLLRGDIDQAADLAFAQIKVDTTAEARLLNELAERAPLEHPARFTDAHRLAMHALEVLDRDGWRHPRLPRLGPLHAPARWAIEFVAQYIVRSYVSDVVRTLARLYARRESQAEPESKERRALARARIQADRLSLGFRGGASGLPTVLIGGAAIPVLASLARQFGAVKPGEPILLGGGSVLFLLFAGLAFVLLQGAGLARRRVTVVGRQPMEALYETIGHCGRPPEDDADTIALVAIGLTAVTWFILPVVLVALATIFRG